MNGLKVGSLKISLRMVFPSWTALVAALTAYVLRSTPFRNSALKHWFQCQYSRPASVTVVTRSGTNALHGRYFRNPPEQRRWFACAPDSGWRNVSEIDPQ